MSYSILYRAFAVTHPTKNEFLICEERGDNNVWEAYSKRRARDWKGSVIAENYRGKFSTKEDFISEVSNIDFEGGCYAVYGKPKRNLKEHLALYNRAYKNAIPFEQFLKYNPRFVQWVNYERKMHPIISSFEDFEEQIENLTGNFYLILDIFDYQYSQIYPKKKRIPRTNNGTHVLYIPYLNGYYKKRSSRRVWYSFTKEGAKKFSEATAKRLSKKLGYEIEVV